MGHYNEMEGNHELVLSDGSSFYLSRRLTNRMKAAYEDWLEGSARRRTSALARDLTPAEMKVWVRSTSEVSAAFKLAWGGEAMIESLTQIPGMVKLFQMLADASGRHPGIDEEAILNILLDPTPIGRPETETEKKVREEAGQEQETYVNMDQFREVLNTYLTDRANFLKPPIRGALN